MPEGRKEITLAELGHSCRDKFPLNTPAGCAERRQWCRSETHSLVETVGPAICWKKGFSPSLPVSSVMFPAGFRVVFFFPLLKS